MSGRSITLGTWKGKPIEWLVLKEEGLATFCISKKIIFCHCYNDNDNKGSNYAKSDIRKYLNCNFFKTAFSEVEKKKIVSVKNTDSNTKDNVFLLSTSEIQSFMTNEERICGSWWYTRTQYNSIKVYDHRNDSASFGEYLTDTDGIRPGVWIKE